MNSDEQDLNINLGLDRNSSAADRQRYTDYQRAQSMDSGSGSSWSPPGGFGILWGLVRSASRSRPQRQSRPRSESANGRAAVYICGIIGAVVAHKTGNPWLAGALIGAAVGAFSKQLVTLFKWGVALVLVALFVGAYNNRNAEKTEGQLYQDAADRFVQEYASSQGSPPPDQTYDSSDAIPPAPDGWRIERVETVFGEMSDGTPGVVYKPIYVTDE